MPANYAALTDEQLLQGYYQCDNAALTELVRRYNRPLAGFLRFLVGPEAVAQGLLTRWWPNKPCPANVPADVFVAAELLDELWQEIWFSKHYSRNRCNPGCRVEGYLFALAGHEAYVRMVR